MMLINGVLCLITAVILLIQMKKSSNLITSQYLLKALWIYWAMLTVKAIHHIFNGSIDPWLSQFISTLDPISDLLNVTIGLLLSFYLFRKRNTLIAT